MIGEDPIAPLDAPLQVRLWPQTSGPNGVAQSMITSIKAVTAAR
jgi:hypothetical protein